MLLRQHQKQYLPCSFTQPSTQPAPTNPGAYVSRIGYSDQGHVHTEQCIICKSLRSCRNRNKNETYASIPADTYTPTHTYAKILNIKSVSAVLHMDHFTFEIKITYYGIRVKYFYRFGLVFRCNLI